MPESTIVRIGAHVDPDDPVAGAAARDATVVQFFIGDPQGWKGPKLAYPAGATALREAAQAAGTTLYVHAPYVINVASTNNRIRIPSRKLLQQQASAAAEVGVAGLIVHGGHVLAGDDPQVGIDNWRKAVERLESTVPVLLENTAGGANAMARGFDRLARLWEAAADANPDVEVGFCLDTCHAHAAGEDLGTVVERVLGITGRLDLLHCNDSRDDAGSGADRHANLGTGKIAADDLVAVARQAVEAGAAIVVETPGGTEGQAGDIAWLRQRLG
jgi:deoxyribonuclease-4